MDKSSLDLNPEKQRQSSGWVSRQLFIVVSVVPLRDCRSVELGGLRRSVWPLPAAALPRPPALPEEGAGSGAAGPPGAAAPLEGQPALCPQGDALLANSSLIQSSVSQLVGGDPNSGRSLYVFLYALHVFDALNKFPQWTLK